VVTRSNLIISLPKTILDRVTTHGNRLCSFFYKTILCRAAKNRLAAYKGGFFKFFKVKIHEALAIERGRVASVFVLFFKGKTEPIGEDNTSITRMPLLRNITPERMSKLRDLGARMDEAVYLFTKKVPS